MGKNKEKGNGELFQILLNIVIIGIFAGVENWLLFYYDCSWVLPSIFGALITLMSCLLAINVYYCLKGTAKGKTAGDDKQVQALLYKQMKKIDADTGAAIAQLKESVNQQIEELKMNQLRSTKALLNKVENAADGGVENAKSDASKGELFTIMQDQLAQVQQAQEELKQLLHEMSNKQERLFENVPAGQQSVEEDEAAAAVEEPEEDFAAEDIGAEPEEDFAPEADFLADILGAEEEAFEPDSLDGEEKADVQEEPPVIPVDDGDPNRQLSPEEIAAMFAGIN